MTTTIIATCQLNATVSGGLTVGSNSLNVADSTESLRIIRGRVRGDGTIVVGAGTAGCVVASRLAERPGNASKFKLDLLKQIPEGEPISYFKNGDFVDLCAGPHVMRTGNIGAFKLTSVAAAYYKGDEKGPQLQRIYGTAFKNKTALDEYFKMLEEAKRRDHRKIGAEMGLFAIDTEYVGPGMPLWLPKGTILVEELEKLAKETEFAAGYVRVTAHPVPMSPHTIVMAHTS